MSTQLPNKILIVDSDESVIKNMKTALEPYQVRVDQALNHETAMYLFNQNLYPVVIIELEFESMPGLILIQKWRQHENRQRRRTAFIATSGNRNAGLPARSKLIEELDNIQTIYKPVTEVQLLSYLRRAKQQYEANETYSEIRYKVDTVGRERANLDHALQLVKKHLPEMGGKGVHLMRDLYEYHEMWENALAVVENVLKSDPKNIAMLNSKGRILMQQGRYEEALKNMEIADKEAPNNIERINAMAMAYLENNQPKKSVAKMKELINFHPEAPDMKFDLFSKLYDHGFDEQAQQLCKDTTNPLEVVRHYNNKGVALAKMGKVDEAIAEYQRSLEFYPKFKENYRIYYNIALAHLSYRRRDHYQAALRNVDRCLELKPEFEKAQKTRQSIKDQLETRKERDVKAS
jgi:tetratricopeptide (TPR) repeat protein